MADKNPIQAAARGLVAGFLQAIQLDQERLGSATLVDGVLELVDSLKAYQEEGQDLRPQVLVFRDTDHGELSQQLGATHFFEVNSGAPRSLASFGAAIKHCAPLAHGVWAVFIVLRKTDLAYGVVRRRYSVTDPPVLPESGAAPPFLWLRQTEKHLLELRGPREPVLEIDFRVGNQATGEPSHRARERLLECLVEKSWPAEKVAVRAVLEEVIDRALTHGHGFLIAVSEREGDKTEVPKGPAFATAGGVIFSKWIIPTQLKVSELLDAQLRGDEEGLKKQLERDRKDHAKLLTARYASLEAWVALIASMLMSDGITWFDNCGRVLGFRIFVRSDSDQSAGGARTRAFAALHELVQKGELRAAFMQSQDGRARFSSK